MIIIKAKASVWCYVCTHRMYPWERWDRQFKIEYMDQLFYYRVQYVLYERWCSGCETPINHVGILKHSPWFYEEKY